MRQRRPDSGAFLDEATRLRILIVALQPRIGQHTSTPPKRQARQSPTGRQLASSIELPETRSLYGSVRCRIFLAQRGGRLRHPFIRRIDPPATPMGHVSGVSGDRQDAPITQAAIRHHPYKTAAGRRDEASSPGKRLRVRARRTKADWARDMAGMLKGGTAAASGSRWCATTSTLTPRARSTRCSNRVGRGRGRWCRAIGSRHHPSRQNSPRTRILAQGDSLEPP